MSQSRKIRVLVVDDSLVVRRMLTRILAEDPAIEVVGAAEDPYEADEILAKEKPDVLTLDIEMPKMDGLTFLRILMQKRPMPVVVMSSLTQAGSATALEALQIGAVDILAKPYGPYSVGNAGVQLVEKVKAAAIARMQRPSPVRTPAPLSASSAAASANKLAPSITATRAPFRPVETALPPRSHFHPRQVILLGASTGGTVALREVLTELPGSMPGICIVQHIPPYFSKAFAERLNQLCQLRVKEAADGDRVLPGLVLIAPGDFHMTLGWHGNTYKVSLRKGPPVWHQRPAVDLLFKTAADCAGKFATAALLTGMGRDGAEGLLRLREAGAHTCAQDEATSVVYGMPKAACDLGAAQEVLPLGRIPEALQRSVAAGVA